MDPKNTEVNEQPRTEQPRLNIEVPSDVIGGATCTCECDISRCRSICLSSNGNGDIKKVAAR